MPKFIDKKTEKKIVDSFANGKPLSFIAKEEKISLPTARNIIEAEAKRVSAENPETENFSPQVPGDSLERLLQKENPELENVGKVLGRLKELSSHSKLDLIEKFLSKEERAKLADKPAGADDDFERERKRIELRSLAARAAMQEGLADSLLEEKIIAMQQRRQQKENPGNPGLDDKLNAEKEKRHMEQLEHLKELQKIQIEKIELMLAQPKNELDVEKIAAMVESVKKISGMIGDKEQSTGELAAGLVSGVVGQLNKDGGLTSALGGLLSPKQAAHLSPEQVQAFATAEMQRAAQQPKVSSADEKTKKLIEGATLPREGDENV